MATLTIDHILQFILLLREIIARLRNNISF